MKLIIYLTVISITLIYFQHDTMAWKIRTHRQISQQAASHSVLGPTKADYLKQLGFDESLNTRFIWNNIKKRLRNG